MEREHKIIVMLVSIVIVVGALIFLARQISDGAMHVKSELNSAIEPMLREMVASGWDRKVFESHSSPALKKWFKKNGYAVKESFNDFGKMKEFQGIQNFKIDKNRALTLSYANFDIGMSEIEIELDKIDEKWLISYINITKMGKSNLSDKQD